MTYGNGLVELSSYNNRLQPTQLRTYNPTTNTDILNLTYGFTNSAGANNGNVVTFNSTATQIFMRTYTYDELNRLSTMSSPADASGCYGLTWTYDAWGNRLSQNPAGGSGSACVGSQPTIYTNNRIIDPGYSHDAAGNMTNDNAHAYTFNAESELTQVDSGSTATYVYDASGQRVRKTTSGISTDYVRDNSGNVVAEIQGSTWTTGYAYIGSHLVAQYNGALGASGASAAFTLSDHLGSTRAMTTVAGVISDSMDYLPFGELLSGGSSTTHKFTGKERDAESGLDNFGARYNSSNLGRFMSPDWSAEADPVPYARFNDPQTLNLYSYVQNNPLNFADPTGHYEVNASNCNGDKKCQKKYDKAAQRFEGARKKDLKSKDSRVKAAAAAFGDANTKNGVHVGFADLSKAGPHREAINGDVNADNNGKDKPIDIEVRVDINRGGDGLQETIAHEGTHIKDDVNFLSSYNSSTGKYDSTLGTVLTHQFTEFNAFRAGAGVNSEHGFGPHDINKIITFINNSPTYRDILYDPVFPNSAKFPQ